MKFTTAMKAVATASVFALMMSTAASAVTLQLHNGGDPRTLDPHKASGNWEDRPISDYIEGLMTLDPLGEPVLGQAASYDVSEDGLVYTFTLRDDAVWSDGTPVTAQDFVLGAQRLQDPATASSYAYLNHFIENAEAINSGEITDFDELGVKAIDDKTVEITLNAPTPYLLAALTHYTAYPVPSHVVEEHGEAWSQIDNLVANGPYVPVEWVPGSFIRSEKNDSYYDAANVAIDEVVYHITEDDNAALNRYRAGEFDILSSFPADQYQLLQDQYPGEAHVAPFLGVYYYVMNQESEALKDMNVRKALSISLNREVIGPDVLGTGELPAYGWVPPGTANYEGEQYMPDWASEDYGTRIADATALMEAAGYSADNPLNLQLRYNTNENHRRIAVAIASMWEPIHVRVELFNAEVGPHYDALQEGDFQIGRAGWLMDYNDASNMLDLLKSGTAQAGGNIAWGNNYGRYSNAEYDALLAQAATELDLVARAGMMHEAEAIAMDEFGVLPIYYYVSKWVISPRISGFEDNAVDRHLTRYLSKSE
ncbi:peptide ABC transporter substrate-binding protein [Devosia sp. YIM 151766]|uniref:peptide ABC transporter substrate-binding protein n=1 Tax=Devosia sp. YIM 151766 TaxID=3017325 RepID=UPI00255C4D2C|nr:peptide ABC transporter substrate-binding protein [Devosia sp. YIM 151766]WIY52330.1 peptide ABC transporter substrate-binding protein [Devosia sp. YIM 151766]